MILYVPWKAFFSVNLLVQEAELYQNVLLWALCYNILLLSLLLKDLTKHANLKDEPNQIDV